MILHKASGRWQFGLALSVSTMALWATLPVALKVTLAAVDPWTLTWFRFLVATALLGGWLAWRGHLAQFRRLSRRGWQLLAAASVALTVNYMAYLLGLDYMTPANAQVLIQLAPLMMALGGILVFRERFALGQWLGLGAMVAGLLLFMSDQAGRDTGDTYAAGVAMMVFAAITWAVYALTQKQLLLQLSSASIMGFIYVVATVLLWPLAEPSHLARLDRVQWTALVYCAFNTLGAYGAFSEALSHWEASRVGAVLALTPLMTVVAVEMTVWTAPGLVASEQIETVGWVGAALAVTGSMAVSLLRR